MPTAIKIPKCTYINNTKHYIKHRYRKLNRLNNYMEKFSKTDELGDKVKKIKGKLKKVHTNFE